jgi:hypothetical protein
MIVTDKFVYIHTSRQAGSFINRLILEHIPGSSMLRYHGKLVDLPNDYKHLPVIGFIRNPWDWYTSMYFNYKSKQQYIYNVISESDSLGFSDTVERFANLGDKSPTSQSLLKILQQVAPDNLAQDLPLKLKRPGLIKNDFKHYEQNMGYYSWLLKKMHEVDGKLIGHFGRFEKLREDLLMLLESTGTPISNSMLGFINNMQALNTNSREPNYKKYYNDTLRDLILERDSYIIDTFSYHY